MTINTGTLLSAVTATGAGASLPDLGCKRTFFANGATTASTGAATILVEVSNVAAPTSADWKLLATVTLTLGTTLTNDGFASDAPWKHVRGNVTAISGTGAYVNLLVSHSS